jgi:hypothetical protein
MVTRGEIPQRNYIQIEPPFDTVAGDRTDYEAVLEFLRGGSNVARGGGARELANTVNYRKQSGGKKTRRKNSNVFRRNTQRK